MIITGDSSDLVLLKLLEITINSITTQRELFLNPIDEPYLWRTQFRRWAVEGLEEARKMREMENQTLQE